MSLKSSGPTKSIFDIVKLLLSPDPRTFKTRSPEDVIRCLTQDPNPDEWVTVGEAFPKTDSVMREMLHHQWNCLPTTFQTGLHRAGAQMIKLMKLKVRVSTSDHVLLQFNTLCDEVEISDFFGLLGYIISAHAYPLMNPRTLANVQNDVTIFTRLLMLYSTLCKRLGGRLSRPSVLHATWIRNPGPGIMTAGTWFEGCLALGCNLNVKDHDGQSTRTLLLKSKREMLNYQWLETEGSSPIERTTQRWAERTGTSGEVEATEWAACAEAATFAGLARMINAKWKTKGHPPQYQFGVLAATVTNFSEETEKYHSDDAEVINNWLLATSQGSLGFTGRAKPMCRNCNTLAYQYIAADVIDFAVQLLLPVSAFSGMEHDTDKHKAKDRFTDEGYIKKTSVARVDRALPSNTVDIGVKKDGTGEVFRYLETEIRTRRDGQITTIEVPKESPISLIAQSITLPAQKIRLLRDVFPVRPVAGSARQIGTREDPEVTEYQPAADKQSTASDSGFNLELIWIRRDNDYIVRVLLCAFPLLPSNFSHIKLCQEFQFAPRPHDIQPTCQHRASLSKLIAAWATGRYRKKSKRGRVGSGE
ncbi:hypothetical protein C8R46DRAFT_1037655 [Mycena filopes]|nr:hypothetical protein C8R46DRAFT_1037655 [Mycena filopes]